MSIEIDTTIGNKVISEKLKCMLADLRSNTRAIFDSVKEIEEQAHSEGFEDFEINLLLRIFLKEFLSSKQIDNLFYRDKKKKVLEDLTSKRVLTIIRL
jgi:pyruvate/oxaloacetate carboxyltransferase